MTGLALLAMAVPAQAATPRPIVYTVVIDGLDGDSVDAGKAPFISSLLADQDARATYYRESRSIRWPETNPNHTAMITGAYVDRSGIPGNSFAVYGTLKEDTCERTGKLDETKAPSVTSGVHPGCSQAEMVFDAVRRQGNPDGLLTAGVFGKPKLGRCSRRSGGREHDPTSCGRRAPTTAARTRAEYCGRVTLDDHGATQPGRRDAHGHGAAHRCAGASARRSAARTSRS